ncbi:unnamed protein product [Notodromas monacha]|uniref:Cuticle protein CPCFC domain-containing protein n=1 Tax=Notodromas monacha TaxID=399045 RepID=A0A7R9BR70_9CRUS|nr:unnamed protein product [Notodromas monacha]CAG0919112.1 unnamed protein product [Notodromas monacha]
MALIALTLAAVLVAANASLLPAKYPAGVNPAACPNYPYCDPFVDPTSGLAVAPYKSLAYGRSLAPLAYNAYPYAYAAAPLLADGGAKYPASVNPAECLNYPYCHDGYNGNHAVGTFKSGYAGVAPVVHAAAVYGHGYAAKYPAGLNPAACPNYPF